MLEKKTDPSLAGQCLPYLRCRSRSNAKLGADLPSPSDLTGHFREQPSPQSPGFSCESLDPACSDSTTQRAKKTAAFRKNGNAAAMNQTSHEMRPDAALREERGHWRASAQAVRRSRLTLKGWHLRRKCGGRLDIFHLVVEQSLDMQKYRQKGEAKQTKSGLFEANCRCLSDGFCVHLYFSSWTARKHEKSLGFVFKSS